MANDLRVPLSGTPGCQIAIRDGVAFLASLRYRAQTWAGKYRGVARGTAQEWNKISFKPALVVDSYNLRSDSAVY